MDRNGYSKEDIFSALDEETPAEVPAAEAAPVEVSGREAFSKVYRYCKVIFEPGGAGSYYRTEDSTIAIGDVVMVPVGSLGDEKPAVVISVEDHIEGDLPLSLALTRFILGRAKFPGRPAPAEEEPFVIDGTAGEGGISELDERILAAAAPAEELFPAAEEPAEETVPEAPAAEAENAAEAAPAEELTAEPVPADDVLPEGEAPEAEDLPAEEESMPELDAPAEDGPAPETDIMPEPETVPEPDMIGEDAPLPAEDGAAETGDIFEETSSLTEEEEDIFAEEESLLEEEAAILREEPVRTEEPEGEAAEAAQPEADPVFDEILAGATPWDNAKDASDLVEEAEQARLRREAEQAPEDPMDDILRQASIMSKRARRETETKPVKKSWARESALAFAALALVLLIIAIIIAAT